MGWDFWLRLIFLGHLHPYLFVARCQVHTFETNVSETKPVKGSQTDRLSVAILYNDNAISLSLLRAQMFPLPGNLKF